MSNSNIFMSTRGKLLGLVYDHSHHEEINYINLLSFENFMTVVDTMKGL